MSTLLRQLNGDGTYSLLRTGSPGSYSLRRGNPGDPCCCGGGSGCGCSDCCGTYLVDGFDSCYVSGPLILYCDPGGYSWTGGCTQTTRISDGSMATVYVVTAVLQNGILTLIRTFYLTPDVPPAGTVDTCVITICAPDACPPSGATEFTGTQTSTDPSRNTTIPITFSSGDGCQPNCSACGPYVATFVSSPDRFCNVGPGRCGSCSMSGPVNLMWGSEPDGTRFVVETMQASISNDGSSWILTLVDTYFGAPGETGAYPGPPALFGPNTYTYNLGPSTGDGATPCPLTGTYSPDGDGPPIDLELGV